MLKALHIKNIQSHKDTYLEFSPGVNIIIGPSDSGKTAILRALRWLIWNRPQGETIRRKQGGVTSVEVVLEDGTVITRSRDKNDVYTLNDLEFKAFRTEVPAEISKALNIDEINLQRQLDAPFLLSETPGMVAQHFNRVANLDIIDYSLQKINSHIRDITQKIEFENEEKTKLINELEKYDYLDNFEKEIEVLEELEKEKLKRIGECNILNSLINSILKIEKEIEDISPILNLEKDIDKIYNQIADYENLISKRESIEKLINSITKIEEDILFEEDLMKLEKPVNEILNNIQELEEYYQDVADLEELLHKIEMLEFNIGKYQRELELKSKEFEESMPDICPLCGTQLKDK